MMRSVILRTALVLASLSLALVAPAVQAGAEEAAQLRDRGRALRYTVKTDGNAIDTGGAAIFVRAPLAVVRKVVTDYRSYSAVMPQFEQSRIVGKKGGETDVYLHVPILHGAANIWTVATFSQPVRHADGTETIAARMKQGNVDDFRGMWRLQPVDAESTIVKLELLIDPKLPLPGSLVTGELAFAADRGVTGVRARSEALAATERSEARAEGPR